MEQKNLYIPGDLVKYNNDLGKVTEIGTSDWYDGAYTCKLRFFSSHNYFTVGQCDIEPIPLTPKILEKNGWKKINIMPYPTYAKGKLSEYSLFLDRDVWRFKYDGRILPVEIKFIHQLQHLLFGLGLNSEMKI